MWIVHHLFNIILYFTLTAHKDSPLLSFVSEATDALLFAKFPSIWVLLLLLPVVEALQEESGDRIFGAIIPPPIWCIINGCCCRFIKWFSVDCDSTGVWKNEPIGTGVGIAVGDPNPPAHWLPMLPTGDGKGGERAVCKGEMLIPGRPAHPVFIVRLLWTGHIPALVP